MTDYRRERQSYVCRAGGHEEANAEMGGRVKRDVGKAGEEEDWKNKTRDRGG